MKPLSDPDQPIACIWHGADDQARSMTEARACHAEGEGARRFAPPVARVEQGLSWIAARCGDAERVGLAFDEATIVGRVEHGEGFTLFVRAEHAAGAALAIEPGSTPGGIALFSSLIRTGIADALGGDAPLREAMAQLLFAATGDSEAPDLEALSALSPDAAMETLLASAQIARRLRLYRAEAALQHERLRRAPGDHMAVQLARALVRAGDFGEAGRVARTIGDDLDAADRGHLARVREEAAGRERLARELRGVDLASSSAASNARIAYCLHNALPYSSGGYAARGHGLARALVGAGRDLVAIARPGFPSDGADVAVEDRLRIDGVDYRFHNSFGRRGRLFGYLAEAADYFEERFRTLEIGLVHAATNYLTALPAGLAARRLGLPFVYEVRSFWNLSREAKSLGRLQTAEARRDDMLEQATLALADRVVTLTDAMRGHLANFGVTKSEVAIVSNSVDPDRWAPRPRDAAVMAEYGVGEGDIVIGYAGAMLGYEGLDLLVEAAAPLIAADPRVRLLMVGADPGRIGRAGTVEHGLAAAMAGIGARATLAPRVPHDRIAEVQALFDICAFPRLPLPVCELISPLKPLEAMAIGKAVAASSVGGMRDMVRDGETGLVHRAGDVQSLRAALVRLIGDPALRARLGENARVFVRRERSWERAARFMGEVYDGRAPRDASLRQAALREALDALFADIGER